MGLFGTTRRKSSLKAINNRLKRRLAKKKRIAAKKAEREKLRRENESLRNQLSK